MKAFGQFTRIDNALKTFFDAIDLKRLPSETVTLRGSLSRVLAVDVVATEDVPNFDRAAVDGYAVRSRDTLGASSTTPVVLDVIASAEMGHTSNVAVNDREAIKIATGAPLPKGADSVLMVEHTEKISVHRIECYRPLYYRENVSARGEDVKCGETILFRSTILRPQDVGMLAALGRSEVEVVRKPTVAVFSTGNELIESGATPLVGEVFDSNRYAIMAMVEEVGGEPTDLGIVCDDREAIRSRLVAGLAQDLIIVSGATSVGEKDFTPEAVNSLGKPGVLVHGIAMRPGRATALAALDKKPIVLLPGFPVSAMIAFEVFARPLILRLLGASSEQTRRPTVVASALRRIPSSLGNRTFVRVVVEEKEEEYVVEPLRTSGSGILSSLVKANGLVILPENKEGVAEGELVEVTLLRPLG